MPRTHSRGGSGMCDAEAAGGSERRPWKRGAGAGAGGRLHALADSLVASLADDSMPASSGRKVMSASSSLASSRSSGAGALLGSGLSTSVSHHGSSCGNSGAPSGRRKTGLRVPACAVWLACAIQCKSPCKTRAVSGCGFRICERRPRRKGTRRRVSYRGCNLPRTYVVGSAPVLVGV